MQRWEIVIFVGVLGQILLRSSGASIGMKTFQNHIRQVRRLPLNSGYLPSPKNTPGLDCNKLTNPPLYPPLSSISNSNAFNLSPEISTKGRSNSQYGKSFSSYAPPASGALTFQYSAPQPSMKIALQDLIPQFVRQDIASQKDLSLEIPTVPPLLMIDEPTSATTTQLTPTQNLTLAAAKLLASSLLDANEVAPPQVATSRNITEMSPRSSEETNQLNRTDVVIVKSQKNAYLVPTQLDNKGTQQSLALRQLYQLRDQLNKAYTINQFIFILKPDKINFLNKLV